MAVEGDARYVVASLYTFSEAAKHEVIEKFRSLNTGQNSIIEFTKEDHFIIRCGKNDPSPLPDFMQLMREFILSELGKVPDITEDVKLERLPETQTETIVGGEDPLVLEDGNPKKPEGKHEEDIVENALIEHETLSRSWRAATNNESIKKQPILSERMLKVIGSLTNCRVELEVGGKGVALKGDSHQDINKAISKLDVVDDWMSLRSTPPLTYNFQCSEGMTDILLEMLPLREIEDRRLHTTLISPQDPILKHLGSHLTIVMRHKGLIILSNQSGRPSSYSSIREFALWKSYNFKNYGDADVHTMQTDQTFTEPSNDSAPVPHLSEHPTVRTVQQWVKQSASKAASNPFVPHAIADEPPAPIREAIVEPDVQPTPVRKRHIKIRKPMGRDTAIRKVPDPDSTESKDTSTASTATTSLKAASSEKYSSGVSEDSQSQDNETLNVSNQVEKVVARSQPQISSKVEPPPIEEPYMPAEPKQNTLADDASPNPHWQRQTVLSARRVGKLIDVAALGSRVQEKVQSRSEYETRSIKRTMEQKKPASFAGSSSSPAVLLRNFEMAVKGILGAAQKSQGPLDLQMEIGRILIKPQSGVSEHKRKQFSPGQWATVFPLNIKTEKHETTFTNMLTTASVDAQFILNLTTSSGPQMFVEEIIERKVSYQFDCRTSAGDHVIVKVDEDGPFVVQCNERSIGYLNWHFPKRFWDARLRMKSYEPVSAEIQNAAREIVKNLRIHLSADRKTFDLGTKIEDGHLQIQSIFLYRETFHRSAKFPSIHLHLSEIQDLNGWQPTGPKGPYEASLQPPKNIISNGGKLWWEVSLSSSTATKTFQENGVLELGTLAGWTPEDILGKDVVKEFYDVTQDLVTNIDSVGYYNRGPKANSATKATEKDRKNEREFW